MSLSSLHKGREQVCYLTRGSASPSFLEYPRSVQRLPLEDTPLVWPDRGSSPPPASSPLRGKAITPNATPYRGLSVQTREWLKECLVAATALWPLGKLYGSNVAPTVGGHSLHHGSLTSLHSQLWILMYNSEATGEKTDPTPSYAEITFSFSKPISNAASSKMCFLVP